MNIVVLVKQVPDTYSERKLRDDGVLDREATDAVLDEINERAVEAALQLKEAHDGSEVTVLTMGPDRATDAIRKALSMGADKAVHLSDDALAGSDAVATAKVLAKAIGTRRGRGPGAGGQRGVRRARRGGARDGGRRAGLARADPRARADGRGRRGDRAPGDRRRASRCCSAELPAVVSVSEKINEPRYPSFKGIMAAKKKPVATLTLADVGVDAGEVGLAHASAR